MKIENKTKVRIVAIAKGDAYYEDRQFLIGEKGIIQHEHHYGGGWYSCQILSKKMVGGRSYFFKVKLARV